jgi:hypothetical protein
MVSALGRYANGIHIIEFPPSYCSCGFCASSHFLLIPERGFKVCCKSANSNMMASKTSKHSLQGDEHQPRPKRTRNDPISERQMQSTSELAGGALAIVMQHLLLMPNLGWNMNLYDDEFVSIQNQIVQLSSKQLGPERALEIKSNLCKTS